MSYRIKVMFRLYHKTFKKFKLGKTKSRVCLFLKICSSSVPSCLSNQIGITGITYMNTMNIQHRNMTGDACKLDIPTFSCKVPQIKHDIVGDDRWGCMVSIHF